MPLVLMLLVLVFATACSNESKSKYVFESKGAVQCEHTGMTPNESAQNLIDSDIEVISAFCALDTRTDNITVCGAGTSEIIVHEIENEDMLEVEELGLENLDVLDGNYSETECSEDN